MHIYEEQLVVIVLKIIPTIRLGDKIVWILCANCIPWIHDFMFVSL